jgi:hypothetical protein
MNDRDGRMTLRDRRSVAVTPHIELDELESLLYRACDDIGELAALRSQARALRAGLAALDGEAEATVYGEVEAALASLVERRLMVGDGGRYLSLALPKLEY